MSVIFIVSVNDQLVCNYDSMVSYQGHKSTKFLDINTTLQVKGIIIGKSEKYLTPESRILNLS